MKGHGAGEHADGEAGVGARSHRCSTIGHEDAGAEHREHRERACRHVVAPGAFELGQRIEEVAVVIEPRPRPVAAAIEHETTQRRDGNQGKDNDGGDRSNRRRANRHPRQFDDGPGQRQHERGRPNIAQHHRRSFPRSTADGGPLSPFGKEHGPLLLRNVDALGSAILSDCRLFLLALGNPDG
jgi:hypothetical protein